MPRLQQSSPSIQCLDISHLRQHTKDEQENGKVDMSASYAHEFRIHMNEHSSLPAFTYHPDPLSTGSIEASDAPCLCCGHVRGYIYTASVYAPGTYSECICPWCIADGSAAEKFEAVFSDDRPLVEAGLPKAVIEEVTRRTPGYCSWQQDEWLSCCDDACQFYGDPPRSELEALQGDALARTLAAWEWTESEWKQFLPHYQPAGNPAVYKFRCRHCHSVKYGIDFT